MCQGNLPIVFALIAFSLELSNPLSKVIRTCKLKMAARNIYRPVLGKYGPAAQPIRMRIGALWTGKLTQPYNKKSYLPLFHSSPLVCCGGEGHRKKLYPGYLVVSLTSIVVSPLNKIPPMNDQIIFCRYIQIYILKKVSLVLC